MPALINMRWGLAMMIALVVTAVLVGAGMESYAGPSPCFDQNCAYRAWAKASRKCFRPRGTCTADLVSTDETVICWSNGARELHESVVIDDDGRPNWLVSTVRVNRRGKVCMETSGMLFLHGPGDERIYTRGRRTWRIEALDDAFRITCANGRVRHYPRPASPDPRCDGSDDVFEGESPCEIGMCPAP